MFKKFNYNPTDYFYNKELNHYLTKGNELYRKHQNEVKDCLSNFISEDGVINGNELKENWFSVSKKDVFISHSHKDLSKVTAFAGWLYEKFDIKAFVDSCAWGYCDDLLKKIDDKYCYKSKNNSYDYNLRNYSTTHVHMMLATALSEMMDQTECVIFFNTPNSIKMESELDKIKHKEKTQSPWIYYELVMSTMLKPKIKRTEKRRYEYLEHSSNNEIDIEYDVEKELKTMQTLTDEELMKWSEKFNNESNKSADLALDLLYQIASIKK